jgi:two-component system response regulator
MDSMNKRIIDILLVEDNPGDIGLTREAFRNCDKHIKLHVAEDGEKAMAFLYKQGKYKECPRPDLILLDLNLPKKDGREVLAEIKQDQRLKRIPVVVLTTSEADEDIIRTYDLHANCYLTKPVDLDKFLDLAQSLRNFWFGFVQLLSEKEK